MTAMPAHSHEPIAFDHLLTIAEYAALGETEPGYTELVEGRLLMSPSPTPKHNIALGRLYTQLIEQVPQALIVIQDIDIDLELVPPHEPGFSRRPDLVLVERSEVERVNSDGGILRASAVPLVVEIVSPGSRWIDNVDKRAQYAKAGIQHYWIIDISKPVSLVDCFLSEEFGYQDHQRATGTFSTDEPFPVTVDLEALC